MFIILKTDYFQSGFLYTKITRKKKRSNTLLSKKNDNIFHISNQIKVFKGIVVNRALLSLLKSSL